MPIPGVDPLVRVRRAGCQDMCHACSSRGPEGEFQECLRDVPCTRKAFQNHGYGCCEWVSREQRDEEMAGKASSVKKRAPEQSDEAIARHSAEIFARLRWCLDSGPQYWPASNHVHKAPGEDDNFVLGVPPWHPDGTPNPAGIPEAHSSVRGLLPLHCGMISEEAYGWECRKCAGWVDSQPRAFQGSGEPPWWWWCNPCRASGGVGKSKTKKQKQEEHLATKCGRLGFKSL